METGIPKKIGRYGVDRLLGSGAMGFVYLGRDPDLDRPVAIKTIRDLNLSDSARKTFLERFRNEARAAGRLQHPGVVQVYDVGEDAEVGPYLVLEYVPGSTLKQILESRGPLEPAEVVDLAEQVASAIDTAHQAGIIHRDIKPDNLLVTADGRTKLADFGVARVPNAALTREGQFLGTPCYAAPETLRDGRYGPLSDVFALAAVLYEAATGTRAFPGDEALAVASKVLHDEPAPPSTVARGAAVPAEVDEVILAGLSKRASERPASGAELTRRVRDAYERAGALDGADTARDRVAAMRGLPAPTPTAPAESHTLRFALFAVLAVGIGVAAIFVLAPPGASTGGDTPPPPVVVDARGDAGPATIGVAHPPKHEEHGDAHPTRTDAGSDAGEEVPLVTIPPEGMVHPDAGATGLTPHDLEERAKDQVELARRLIAQHRWDDARKALDTARQDDPNNADIARLQAQLPSGPGSTPTPTPAPAPAATPSP